MQPSGRSNSGGGGEGVGGGGDGGGASLGQCPCSCMYFSHGQQLLLPLLRFFFHTWQPGQRIWPRDRTWLQQHTQTAAGERVNPCVHFAVLSSSLMQNSQRWASRSGMRQRAPPSIPAASSTATARVSKLTASLNAPHMCSCCGADSPAGVHCCMRWTSESKCEENCSRRFLHTWVDTQASSQASQSHHRSVTVQH